MFKYVLIPFLLVSSINCISNSTFESLKNGISPFNDAGNSFFNLIRGDIDTSLVRLEEFLNLTLSFESLKKITSVYLSHTILLAAGITFAVLLPIIGLFFCCCRCCGRCGGKIKSMDPRHVKCKKTFNSILLTILTLGMMFSVIITLFNNQIVHESLISSNPSINLFLNVNSKLDRIKSSLEPMKMEIRKSESSQIDSQQMRPFTASIEGSVKNFFTNFNGISDVLELYLQSKEMETKVLVLQQKKLQENLRDMDKNIKDLDTELRNIKNAVSQKLSTCTEQPACDEARKKTDALTINKISETDINSIIDALNYVTSKNFEEALIKITKMSDLNLDMNLIIDKEANNLKNRINEKSFSESVKDKLIQEIDKIILIQNHINDYMPVPLKNESRQYEYYRIMKNIEQYRYYVYIGLSLCITLIIMFYLLGLLYGNCGERPEEDAGCFNRGVGANFIMISITLTFLFCSLIMITVLTNIFTTSVIQTDFCRLTKDDFKEMKDPKARELVDRYLQIVAKGFSDTQHVPDGLVESLFFNCEKQNFYMAFSQINHKYLIMGLQAPLNEIDSKLTTFLTNRLSLSKYLDTDPFAVVSNLDFNKLSNSLYLLSDAGEQAYSAEMQKLPVNTSFEMAKIKNLNSKIDKSRLSLKTMFLDVFVVQKLYVKWRSLAKTFDVNKVYLIKPHMSDLLRAIEKNLLPVLDLLFGTMFANVSCSHFRSALRELLKEICQNFVDPLNGCWYGLGFFLLLVIPALICACVLVSLYRRVQKFYPDKEEPDYENYLGFYARVDNEAMKSNASQSKAPHRGYKPIPLQ